MLERLVALVAPPRCAACGAPVGITAPPVCSSCAAALPWLRGTRCLRCALPRHRGAGCPAADASFDRAWAPLAYEGVARELVAALKFHRALAVADLMAAQLAANLPGDLRQSSADVVAVPAHAGRRRRRGYDPAELIAAAFARRTGRALQPCLRRRDRLEPLKLATAAERARGPLVIDALAARVPPAVLLVDDVHTTGATLRACAEALRAGGCEQVAAVTYARAL